MKLKEWAKNNGYPYKTALRLFHRGELPVPAKQFSPRMIVVSPKQTGPVRSAALYARVAKVGSEPALENQIVRMSAFALTQGIVPTRIVREIGSDRYGMRPKLLSLLRDLRIDDIIVERREVLPRFEFEYAEAMLASFNRRIVIVDSFESKDDLETDVLEMIAKVCAIVPGTKSAMRRAQRVLKAMEMIE